MRSLAVRLRMLYIFLRIGDELAQRKKIHQRLKLRLSGSFGHTMTESTQVLEEASMMVLERTHAVPQVVELSFEPVEQFSKKQLGLRVEILGEGCLDWR